jgi:enoyl-CoA hydratase/carnithine racemase
MNYYSKDLVKKIFKENFEFIKLDIVDNLITIKLNRPNKRNAIHPQTLNELAFVLQYVYYTNKIRVILLESSGSVFCSGLDLDAIKGNAASHNSSIPNSKKKILLGQILTEVHTPIISKVEGSVYAGGYIYLACSTYVIASDHLKFSLPEVKRGIFPMQVMGLLMRVMMPRNIIDWCIRGYSLSANKAKKWGLISKVVPQNKIDQEVKSWTKNVIENSPKAISLGLEAFENLIDQENNQKYLAKMLNKVLKSDDAKEGITAFKEKRRPKWKK